jgi:hypothetical protein
MLYNLPSYLVKKKFFIQLCISISGKDSPMTENIDVFMQPLVEELQILWAGVPTQDFSKPPRQRRFTLRGILMWTIADYQGYGLISELCTHGFKGCVVYGPETKSKATKTGNKLNTENNARGSKVIYGGGRRWTARHHPYRRNLQFDGRPEDRLKPIRMSARETIQCAEEHQNYISNGRQDGGPLDPIQNNGVKYLSYLYQLEYWKVRKFLFIFFLKVQFISSCRAG